MFKRIVQFTIIGLAFVIASESHADSEPNKELLKLIMGGSPVGVRDISKQDAEITWNVAMGEILKPYGIELTINIYKSTQDLFTALNKGEINGIFGTPLEFLAHEDNLGKQMMAVRYKNVSLKQSLVIITRKSDSSNQIKWFKNKRLTLANSQDIETLYLNTLLMKNKLPEIPIFFSEQLDVKNSNIAIMNVFFNKSDLTIVRENEFKTAVELNPQIGKKLTILEKSPPYLFTLGAWRKDLESKSTLFVINAMHKSVDSEKGRSLLSMVQAESLEAISPDELQSVRDLINEYKSLQKFNNPLATVSMAKAKVKRNAQ